MVSVVFAAPVVDVAARLTRPDGTLTALDAGHARYETRVDRLDWFAATLAVLGIPFTVEDPDELTTACRTLSATLAR